MFKADLTYTRQDGSKGHVLYSQDTEEALRKATIKDMAYYLSIGYTLDSLSVSEVCNTCQGDRVILKPRAKRIPCPACKGQGI